MAKIIGRKKELKELQRLYESDEAEMLVVYGRRRVGKTFLINQAFNNIGFTFKTTGLLRQNMQVQLSNFREALMEYFPNAEIGNLDNWMTAFSVLKKMIIQTKTEGKKVIFFDELPWLDTKGSNFLGAFEWFWNTWGNSQDNLMMIICGSATNWIINKLFSDKGGLYNRASSKMFLRPFTLAETEKYLQKQGFDLERYDIAQIYMIMGGIPYYLKQLEPGRTVADNIDNCFFRKNGKLWDEYDNLFKTLFVNSDKYEKIVEALSAKQKGLTREEILSATKLPDNGVTSQAVKDLIKCGFIRAYQYYGQTSKDTTYQLADFYTMFYNRFIKKNYGHDEHFWTHLLDNPKKNNWQGYCFEQLCKDHIEPLKHALGIGSVLTEQSCWFSRSKDQNPEPGAQIDLLIDRRDNYINVCEMKFSVGEFVIDKDYSTKLRNKLEALKSTLKKSKGLVLTMVTTFGVKHNMYYNQVKQEVVLDDLFLEV